jgi:hypothetical protein
LYRLFLDETGHDNLKIANEPREQYLCLMGVIMDLAGDHEILTQKMDALKVSTFGTTNVVLHRRELIDKKPPPFDKLHDAETRTRFDTGLLDVVANCEYVALAVLIDKKEHTERYAVWKSHPYHYCLRAMMERYVMWLKGKGAVGDVMAEWRGIKPNKKLEQAYTYIYRNGTGNVSIGEVQTHMSSAQLKIRKKEANIAGLQLADMLASPASRELICMERGEEMTAPFGKQVVKILRDDKYRRSPNGKISGWGTKTLP